MTTPLILIPSGWLDSNACDRLDQATLYRLEAGLHLWRQDTTRQIIVTGGTFRPLSIQTRPAAMLMADWLIEHGVPMSCIIREHRSLDTFENISFAIDNLRALNINPHQTRITVISQWQHCLRFWATFLLAHKLRVNVKPLWYIESFKAFLVEWAFLAYHLFDWHGEMQAAVNNRAKRRARQE